MIAKNTVAYVATKSTYQPTTPNPKTGKPKKPVCLHLPDLVMETKNKKKKYPIELTNRDKVFFR